MASEKQKAVEIMNERVNKELTGLTAEQVKKAKEKYGKNVYPTMKRKSILLRFLENLNDPIIRILLIAMGVNILFTIRNVNWAETAGIIVAVLVSSVVSTLSEYGSEKVFEKMKQENKRQTVKVLRDGTALAVPFEELVVGDLILLEAGEKIPADGTILSGRLLVDQSAINGESVGVEKRPGSHGRMIPSDRSSLFAGSLVNEGEGVMQASGIGKETMYGKIAMEVQIEKEVSPLKKRLSGLAKTISRLGYLAAFFVALTYLFGAFVMDADFLLPQIIQRITNLRYVAMTLMRAVTIAMTVIVVAVPEGLPMMITVVLASNMKRMLKDHVLVRRLMGIETAGCMDLLFTDKTGTLTKGQIECTELIFGNGECYNGSEDPSNLKRLLIPSIMTNSSCYLGEKGILGGNPTERALVSFLSSHIKCVAPNADEKIRFDSKNKYSAALIKEGLYKGVYYKGAPEKILPYCTKCYDEKGRLTGFDKKKMEELIEKLSKSSARIVAMATAERFSQLNTAGEMTFLCIAVLRDGLRKEAKEAVKVLKNAGIRTVMITGDSKDTASSVARSCGIGENEKCLVLDSEELKGLSDEALARCIDRISVVARAMPDDKRRLVRIAQQKGHVVGMTGDGINDAPALKKSDVGFAMGSGSEIAKEAGDIVILDNNLISIAKAVLYGRTIFKSIRKFITFQLTMNLCAVGVSLFGQFLGVETPITVIQMLWVNMIMDTLGGLAFAGEFPLNYYMKERPIGREEPILSKKMISQTLIMGGFGTLLSTFFLCSPKIKEIFGYSISKEPLLTAFFALFIFTGLAICFTARSERLNLFAGLTKNRTFIVIMLFIVVIQLIMLYYGGKTFRCTGLSIKGLLLVNTCSLTVIPIDLLRRWLTKTIGLKSH